MSETRHRFTEAQLERALIRLGKNLSYPPLPDLRGAVRAHLEEQPIHRRPPRTVLIRRALFFSALAVLSGLASIPVLSPDARSAVASWFHLHGVMITSGGSPPGPLGHNLSLGRRMSLEAAQKQAPFGILVPSLPNLRRPDEIYASTNPLRGRVSLVYRARAGIPRASTTGAGLLITEVVSPFFVGKTAPVGTTMTPEDINGDQGVWLAGQPHFLFYFTERGKLLRDSVRLAGNVLLWRHGVITLRIEGQIPEDQSVRIAQSMEVRTR